MLINKNDVKYIKNYLEFFKQYLRFKQHYNIEIPAEICGHGTRFDFIKVKIGDLRRIFDGKVVSLRDCAQFRYLSTGNKQIYESYIDEHITAGVCSENSMWKTQGTKKLDSLFQDIAKNGYDPTKSIICIDENNVVLDGVHRSSCLLKIYGDEYEIPVIRVSK